MNETIKQAKDMFESITCICAEGQEVLTKMEMAGWVLKVASKGFDLCKAALEATDDDKGSLWEDGRVMHG